MVNIMHKSHCWVVGTKVIRAKYSITKGQTTGSTVDKQEMYSATGKVQKRKRDHCTSEQSSYK